MIPLLSPSCRRLMIPLALAMLPFSAPPSCAAPVQPPTGFLEVPLWPGTPPATPDGALPVEQASDDAHVARVATPRLWLSLPARASNTPAVPTALLLPGGGYGVVGHRYEGTEVARELNKHGIAAAVLLYRCCPQLHPAPLLDARRALEILHQRAKEWHLNPAMIGVVGFSAGGHLAGLASSTLATTPPSPAGQRPAFTVLVYPVVRLYGELSHGGSGKNLLGPTVAASADKLALDALADASWPRTYLLHEANDPGVPSAGTATLAAKLQALGVTHSLNIVPGKDHGFGWNRPDAQGQLRGPADWLPRVADWIRNAPGDNGRWQPN